MVGAVVAALVSVEEPASSGSVISAREVRRKAEARDSGEWASDTARIQDTMERFLDVWFECSEVERAAMANFFAFFRYEPALDVLRWEAWYLEGPSAVASLKALAAMGDVQSIELFRDAVRYSGDCEAVRISAKVLGQWRDNASYSLLIRSLLYPRCDGETVIEQFRALFNVSHPYIEQYLYLIHQVTTSPEAKLAAAAALALRAEEPKRSVIDVTLRSALRMFDCGETVFTSRDEQLLLLALWGLGRYSRATCKQAREHALALFDKAKGESRARIARALLAAELPCLKLPKEDRDRLIRAAGIDTFVAQRGKKGTPRRFDLPRTPEPTGQSSEWVDWLVQLATCFSLWDKNHSIAQFAESVERLSSLHKGQGKGPLPFPAEVDPTVRVPRPVISELERSIGEWTPPEDFDRYTFPTGQPEWWPSWIDITIDDGPRPRWLGPVLDVLDAHGVKATFFFIGVNIVDAWEKDPNGTRALFDRMLSAGHRIGYHSMSHITSWYRHLQAWTPGQILDDIELFDTVYFLASGRNWDRQWARLPGGMGRSLAHVRFAFFQAGLHSHVHWTIQDPEWGPASTNEEICALAYKLVKLRKPTVILLHECKTLSWQLATFLDAVHRAVDDSRLR